MFCEKSGTYFRFMIGLWHMGCILHQLFYFLLMCGNLIMRFAALVWVPPFGLFGSSDGLQICTYYLI